jgi:hypothetical protein
MTGAGYFPWTDAAIAELKRLWATGVSCSEIARQLSPLGHVSRNGVIGKVSRLGLPYRHAQKQAGRMSSAKIVVKPPQQPVAPPQQPANLPTRATSTLEAVGFAQCRFPMWRHETGAPDYPVCGRLCGIAETYCAPHKALTSTPVTRAGHGKGGCKRRTVGVYDTEAA